MAQGRPARRLLLDAQARRVNRADILHVVLRIARLSLWGLIALWIAEAVGILVFFAWWTLWGSKDEIDACSCEGPDHPFGTLGFACGPDLGGEG